MNSSVAPSFPAEPASPEVDLPEISAWRLAGLDYPTYRLSLVAKLIDRLTLRQLSGTGDITISEWRVLGRLVALKQATVGEIARRAMVDRAEVSRAVAVLEGRGWVTRRDNPADRRSPLLSITEAGIQGHLSVSPQRQEFHESLLVDLSPEERLIFDQLLARIGRRCLQQMNIPVDREGTDRSGPDGGAGA